MKSYETVNGKRTSSMMVLMMGSPSRRKMRRKKFAYAVDEGYVQVCEITCGAALHMYMMADCDGMSMHEMKRNKRSINVYDKNGGLFVAMPEMTVVENLPVVEICGTPKYRKGNRFRQCEKGCSV